MKRFHAPIPEIRLALENRGIPLRRAASEKSIAHLREVFPVLEDHFSDIYREFDGFESWNVDGASIIEIWGIDKIISKANSSKYDSIDCMAFGDFMMGSEYICCLVNNLGSPVFYDESKEILADSYFDFWKKFCSGELDFL